MTPHNRQEAKLAILRHLLDHVGEVVSANTLHTLAGRYSSRRLIEDLQRKEGWLISTGAAVIDMVEIGDWPPDEDQTPGITSIQPDDVILLDSKPDPDAPRRWRLAKSIRDADR